jgi:hypothetical protein
MAGECCFECCCKAQNPDYECCKSPGPGGICCDPRKCCGTEEEPVCCGDGFCCKGEVCEAECPGRRVMGVQFDGECCDEDECCVRNKCGPCPCVSDGDCPPFRCCKQINVACASDQECPGDLGCLDGECVNLDGSPCVPDPEGNGRDCDGGASISVCLPCPCEEQLDCGEGGKCCEDTEEPYCCAEEETCCEGVCCPENIVCCGGVCCEEGECCVGGVCQQCCEEDEDCPEGECCNDGECGECPCESDEDCIAFCPEGFTLLTAPDNSFAFCCPDGTFLGDDPSEACQDGLGGTGLSQPSIEPVCCDGVCLEFCDP